MYYIPRSVWVVSVFCFFVGWLVLPTYVLEATSISAFCRRRIPRFCATLFLSSFFSALDFRSLLHAIDGWYSLSKSSDSFLYTESRFSAIVFCSTLPYFRHTLVASFELHHDSCIISLGWILSILDYTHLHSIRPGSLHAAVHVSAYRFSRGSSPSPGYRNPERYDSAH